MLYSRPESPPPRVPSPPPFVFTPLASPSSRSHRKPSTSSSAPSLPPGLQQERTLLMARSFEHIPSRSSHIESRHRQPKRTRSALVHTASSLRTNSLPEPFVQSIISQPHQRSVSLTSRISPPPSPETHTPPVPPIPSFILTPAEEKNSRSIDSRASPIHFASFGSISSLPAKSAKKAHLGKTRIPGVSCLKLFSLRNSLKSD